MIIGFASEDTTAYTLGVVGVSRNDVFPSATPCPKCAYDLRGHPDLTTCPECGTEVAVGSAIAQAVRWIDVRLLDLWSIGVLQAAGGAVAISTMLAVRMGHYAALILGMMSMVSVSVATIWFLALSPGIVLRMRRPFVRTIGADRMGKLFRWWLADAVLVAIPPLVFVTMT